MPIKLLFIHSIPFAPASPPPPPMSLTMIGDNLSITRKLKNILTQERIATNNTILPLLKYSPQGFLAAIDNKILNY